MAGFWVHLGVAGLQPAGAYKGLKPDGFFPRQRQGFKVAKPQSFLLGGAPESCDADLCDSPDSEHAQQAPGE